MRGARQVFVVIAALAIGLVVGYGVVAALAEPDVYPVEPIDLDSSTSVPGNTTPGPENTSPPGTAAPPPSVVPSPTQPASDADDDRDDDDDDDEPDDDD